jgi:hypothetical protein
VADTVLERSLKAVNVKRHSYYKILDIIIYQYLGELVAVMSANAGRNNS